MGKKSTKLGVASLIAAGAGIAAVAAKSKKTEEKKRVKEYRNIFHRKHYLEMVKITIFTG